VGRDVETQLTVIERHGSKIYQGVRAGVDKLLVIVLVLLETYHSEPECEFTEGWEKGRCVDTYR